MTLEEMLRGSPLNQQRMADDNAMNLAGMLARGRAGTVRQEPSLMQGIGGAIADYAVPDRYSDAINPSVMSPKLGSLTGVKEDGVPYSMADAPDPVPLLMDTMPMAGITAFHGSPHKFSKFDMSKIGTGVGAQHRGHGLYAAENPNVAQGFADQLTREIKAGKNTIQSKGKIGGTTGNEDVDDYLIADRGDASLALSNMKKHRLEIANGKYPEAAKNYDAGIEMLEEMIKEGEVQTSTAGNLYKLDIPDDQIAKMLDWDKPLSEQPDIQTKLDEISKFYGLSKNDYTMPTNVPENIDARTLEILKHQGAGSAIYKALAEKLGGGNIPYGIRNNAGASEAMAKQGIPGIKYADQGTSNFVLFADDIAKILERNGQPIGDLAEGLKAGSKLPMDEASRMGRAKEQGFDTDKTWFRGTEKDYKRNKKDSFYSSDPEFAEQFTYGTGPISPVHAKGKIFDPSNKDSANELIAKMDELNAHAKANPYTGAEGYHPYSRGVIADGVASGDAHKIESGIAQQALKELGYDGTRLTEGGVENLMMFNPKNIRSKFAKFDPTKKNSGNLLAGAGAGFLASQLLGQDRN